MSELVYEESSATSTVLWEDIPIEELREYILSRHLSEDAARHGRAPHNGAVKVQTDQPAMPDSFRRFAANTFADLDIFEWQYWTGYYDRECPPGQPNFVSGMPHAHGWDGSRHAQYKLGHTLVMYVQVPERGGELVVMPEFRTTRTWALRWEAPGPSKSPPMTTVVSFQCPIWQRPLTTKGAKSVRCRRSSPTSKDGFGCVFDGSISSNSDVAVVIGRKTLRT